MTARLDEDLLVAVIDEVIYRLDADGQVSLHDTEGHQPGYLPAQPRALGCFGDLADVLAGLWGLLGEPASRPCGARTAAARRGFRSRRGDGTR